MRLFKPVAIVSVSLIGLFVMLSFAIASERAPQGSRTDTAKKVQGGTSVIRESERPLTISYSNRPATMGYQAGNDEAWVRVGSEETGYIEYRLETVSENKSTKVMSVDGSSIKPENFVNMRGTRHGIAALTGALSQMLADQQPAIREVSPPVPGTGSIGRKIDGIAIFEEAGVMHLLTVRVERDETVFEDMGFVAAGCNANLPAAAGGCGCSAGQGGTCTGYSGADGKYHVSCTDSAGTMGCVGGGGICDCGAGLQ